jgi:DNA helicase HerA-like ATPase
VPVRLPLQMFNRHGLIAGATGTGKTKTLQLFAEQLSEQGVPVFLADLKGDLTGLADPAPATDVEGFLAERMTTMGFDVGPPADDRTPTEAPDASNEPPLWRPRGFPVELLSLTGTDGHQVRVPLREFGPLLLAKVMDCTDVQESVLQVVWQVARDRDMPLTTVDDLDRVLRLVTSEEGAGLSDEYGGMATQTINVLRRKLVQLEGQGADRFFGDPGFDVTQLWRPRDGEPFGVISILRLVDVQARPRIFSTFLMWLLSAVYANAEELGDPERPRLVFFFDEAHLLFEGASRSLLELVELTVRMIRSKGIGVFFVTQQPTDLPDDVLAQLGTRVQHALRAFTPNDQQALQATARTYPVTEHYDVRATLTGLGIGEALLVGLGR